MSTFALSCLILSLTIYIGYTVYIRIKYKPDCISQSYYLLNNGNIFTACIVAIAFLTFPALRSLSVTVTSSKVQYDFNNHRNVGRPYRGLLIINLAQPIPTGTTTTLPVVFTTSGGNEQPLVKVNGAPATVEDISGTGIYLVWYESQTNTLQLINL